MHRTDVLSTLILGVAACVLASSLPQACLGQNAAAQAVRSQASKLDQQTKITAGPDDSKQEKVPPGRIDKDAPKEFKTTKSGLKYRILRKSDGKKPKASDQVEVNYKGWLDDKSIFDSSYRRGKTTKFPLNGVIKGWTEGLQLVGERGMIELDIPHELAYGDRGIGPIPPKSRLHFIVELIRIN